MEIPICNTCNSSKPNSYVLVCTGCASKIKESQTTDTQQLKAKIAAYATRLESDYHGGCGVNINRIIERLQQLSAI